MYLPEGPHLIWQYFQTRQKIFDHLLNSVLNYIYLSRILASSIKFPCWWPRHHFPLLTIPRIRPSRWAAVTLPASATLHPLILAASCLTRLHDWSIEVSESTPLNCFLSFLGIYVKPIANHVIPLSPSVTTAPPFFLFVADKRWLPTELFTPVKKNWQL